MQIYAYYVMSSRKLSGVYVFMLDILQKYFAQ